MGREHIVGVTKVTTGDASGAKHPTQSASATPEPVAAPLVGTGEMAGPLSRGEIDTLTIAHFVLARGSLSLAVESLLRHAHPAGKSGVQKLVLASDLEELRRRMDALNAVQWPNDADEPRLRSKKD